MPIQSPVSTPSSAPSLSRTRPPPKMQPTIAACVYCQSTSSANGSIDPALTTSSFSNASSTLMLQTCGACPKMAQCSGSTINLGGLFEASWHAVSLINSNGQDPSDAGASSHHPAGRAGADHYKSRADAVECPRRISSVCKQWLSIGLVAQVA